MSGRALRLLVYDQTCHDEAKILGLSTAWSAGALLYRGLGRLDAARGVSSWEEAFDWLATVKRDRPIAEIQYWGHGKWGRVLVDRASFDASALSPAHPLHARLAAVRERLVPGGEALVWFRTCETAGALAGQDFVARLADHLGARVAGHTFVIGVSQSGLRGVSPGAKPDWSPTEGLAEGTAEAPVRALWSGPREVRTVTCFHGAFPASWITP